VSKSDVSDKFDNHAVYSAKIEIEELAQKRKQYTEEWSLEPPDEASH